jgi:hypothetical protein
MKREAVRGAPIDLKSTQQRAAEATGVSERSLRRIKSELAMTEFGASTSFAAHHKVEG